jgi:pyruvate/2-oxoglutarate dehydrogenase complex dihydrolipoamide acyltransferase (E2) component
MPQVPILMPQLGESIAEATVVRILFEQGETIQTDQEILEVETNKATMGVTAPSKGKIASWNIEVGQSYPVGATLGMLETESAVEVVGSDAPATAPDQQLKKPPKKTVSVPAPARPAPAQVATVEPTVKGGLPVPASAVGASYLSPRMKARMTELGLHAADLAGVAGRGAGGRVTIEDLERFLSDIERNQISPASSMRVAVADAMRRSWTRPLATVGRPVMLDRVLEHRRTVEGKPGPTLYAIRALAIALGENSAPAGRLIGDRIIHPRSIDIGFAVEAEEGVLVPVIRNADQAPLADLMSRYDRLVDLARQRRLPPGETGGSIATITNYGVFGLTLATPIPLPEQTVLLGMGAGEVVPKWNKAKAVFEPVTESIFTLSFDHRVLDGGAAGRLLQRVAELLADPESL